MRRVLLLIWLVFTLLIQAYAQDDLLNKRITLKAKRQNLTEILSRIESLAGVTFSYNIKIIPQGKYNLNVRNEELRLVLAELLSPQKLSFSLVYGSHIVISASDPNIKKFTVSGYIRDEYSGERLIGVQVTDRHSLKSSISNQDGYYTITLPSDSITLLYISDGYKGKQVSTMLDKNIRLDMTLRDETEYTRYTITSKTGQQTSYKPDEFHFNSKTLRLLPVLFGESDIMKGLQLLPGVSAGNDGTISLNIRGGSPEQNLILLDDIPLYNPSHIYGFFSVFNSDIVKDVRLIKGGMSSRYSGRLSSVIDVRTLDGNNKKIKFQTSAGILSSKLTIDGPLGKNRKTTFIASGRRSYLDLLSNALNIRFSGSNASPFRTGYYFYDANGKLNHTFSRKHQLSVSFYTGRDNSLIKNSFSVKNPAYTVREKDEQNVFWGNDIVSLRSNHVISPKISAWVSLAYTSYSFGNESFYEYSENRDSQKLANTYRYKFISRIRNGIFSCNTEYKSGGILTLKTGAGIVLHEFNREISTSDELISKQSDKNLSSSAFEYNAYADAGWKLSRRIQLNTGLHLVSYHTGSVAYPFVQPRLKTDYKISKSLLFHAAYQNTAQFLHLLTSNSLGMPLDLWVPSTANTRPETSDLVSAGLSFSKGTYALNAEAFYRKLNHIIEYRDATNYIGSDNEWEDKITVGKGRAYGYEFLAEKKSGKTRGWISYTLSWNYRQFEGVNGGQEFPYKYDRRHNLASLISHEFSKQIDVSASWIYSTGANYTLPEQIYSLPSGGRPSNLVYIYGDRNNYKFPDYHRLDFGINFKKHRTKYSRVFSIGAYNVYNRLNPFYISPAYNQKGERTFEAVSLFPAIPSFNYKIIF